MANTQPVQLSYSLVDELGVKAATTMYALVDPATTITELAAQWQTFLALLQAVTGASITGGKAGIVAVPAGAAPAPVAGSRVEQTGLFNFAIAGTGKRYGVDVPALLNTLIVDDKIVDATGAVAALTAAISAAWGDALGQFASNQFVPLGALLDLFLSFRKHRKQLRSLTYEI